MSKTSKSTQTTTPANPAVTGAYTDLVNQAQTQASTPYNPYNGELVAGINGTQNQAISGLGAAAGAAQPLLGEAANYVRQSATQINPMAYSQDAINQYMSPYTQNVVDATQNQFNQQNAAQQSGLRGSAAASGALGGDREAILQSQLAGQQQTAQAPVIAGLYNTGFNNAQGEFNTQQGVGLSAAQANSANAANAGSALGNLGLAGQNSLISGNNALLNAGTLQQQTAQAGDTAGYGSYVAAQQYPYQNLDFLSQILGGAAQGSGSTTSGTQTTPFNLGNFLLNGASKSKHGGRVGLAAGGVPNLMQGYVPQASPVHAQMTSQVRAPSANNGSDSSGLGLGFHDILSAAKGVGDWLGSSGVSEAGKGMGALGLLGFAAGGRPRLADGGDPSINPEDILEGLAAAGSASPATDAPAPAGATALTPDQTPPAWRGQVTSYAPAATDTGAVGLDPATLASDGQAPAQGFAGAAPAATPAWDDGTPVASGPNGSPGLGAAAASNGSWNVQPNEPDTWHSVLAGLGGLLQHGLGAGIQAGLKDYDDQRDPHPVVDHTGNTIRIITRGARGEMRSFDTGMPTELATAAKATNAWRLANMDANKGTREDAIAARAQASADAVAQRREAAEQASRDRAASLQVARINATAGRYGAPVPGMGVGPDGKTQVPGAYVVNSRTGQPEFHPGVVLTQKTPTSFRSLPAMVAAKFMTENPNASAQDAENFAAAYGAHMAGATAAGRGSVMTAVNEGTVNNSIGILRKLIPTAASTGPVTGLNDLFQAIARHTNDADAANFKNAVGSITAEYARVMTGATGGAASSDSARHEAEERILLGYNNKTLPAVLDQMQAEMRGRSGSYGDILGQITGGRFSGPQTPGAATGIPPAPAAGSVVKGYRFKGGNPADQKNWEIAK